MRLFASGIVGLGMLIAMATVTITPVRTFAQPIVTSPRASDRVTPALDKAYLGGMRFSGSQDARAGLGDVAMQQQWVSTKTSADSAFRRASEAFWKLFPKRPLPPAIFLLLDPRAYDIRTVALRPDEEIAVQGFRPMSSRGRPFAPDRMEVDPEEASLAYPEARITITGQPRNEQEEKFSQAQAGCSRAVKQLREFVNGRNRIDHFDELCLFSDGQRHPKDLTDDQRAQALECQEYYHDYDRFCFLGDIPSETLQQIRQRVVLVVRHRERDPFSARIICSAFRMPV